MGVGNISQRDRTNGSPFLADLRNHVDVSLSVREDHRVARSFPALHRRGLHPREQIAERIEFGQDGGVELHLLLDVFVCDKPAKW